MPHFTCIGASKENVKEYLNLIKNNNINSILALRGDVPQDCEDFEFNDDFRFASDLVEFIKAKTNLSIGVAGYPEIHKEALNAKQDLENLKKKIDSGANAIITQVFFNNDHYFDFVEKARQEGINAPIIPGILPITNLKQIERMVSMCGSEIPIDLIEQITKHQDDKKTMRKIGIEFAVNQCQELINSGVSGIHFYTLNKAGATKEVLENIL
jgi:methylenetetrahydrofolate reductase (NADPH)